MKAREGRQAIGTPGVDGWKNKQRGSQVMSLGGERTVPMQFLGAMNQFYKYDKHRVGAYNLAHPKPVVGAQHCLTSDEHCEVSTVVGEWL